MTDDDAAAVTDDDAAAVTDDDAAAVTDAIRRVRRRASQ
jgi:hypothetical protein